MLKKQTLVPNWSFEDRITGDVHQLWDFRQKTHLVLLYDPRADSVTAEWWRGAAALDHARWDWLRVQIFVAKKLPEGVTPGVYAIDRYGLFLNYFALDHWSLDDLEHEFIYYEACHC